MDDNCIYSIFHKRGQTPADTHRRREENAECIQYTCILYSKQTERLAAFFSKVGESVSVYVTCDTVYAPFNKWKKSVFLPSAIG